MERNVARMSGLADLVPLIVRLVVGGMIAWHGWLKLDQGTGVFADFLESLDVGIPSPDVVAQGVTFLELGGGILLILGLLSRLVSLLLIAELVGAIYLVTFDVGLVADTTQPGVGFERDLAYILCFFVVLVLGPGKPSLDHFLRIERVMPAFTPARMPAQDSEFETEHRPL